MMGQRNRNQGQLFYSFCLEEVVPTDHLVRDICCCPGSGRGSRRARALLFAARPAID